MELRYPEGTQSRAANLWYQKEPLEVVWAFDKDASWMPPVRGFLGTSHRQEALR